MLQLLDFNHKISRVTALAILLLSIALFAFTGQYLFAVIPFAYLFLMLVTVNWKTAYWVFLFTIPPSIHVWFFGYALSSTLPDEPIMWVFLLVFILLWARNPNLLPTWWWKNWLTLIIVLQFVWLIVAVVFSQEPLYSIKFLLAKCWFMVSFFILPVFIFKEKKDFRTAFLVTLIPLLATVLIIFYRHYQIAFNFRKVEKAIAGIYYNHVDYSTVLSMFFPVLCITFSLTKGKNWLLRGTLLAIIIFFLPAIYFTYARAAMLAVVFAIVIYAAIRLRLVNFVMPAFYGLMILLIVYMAKNNKFMDFRPTFEQTYMHHTWTDHVIATFRGEDMSSMERLYRWIAGVRMSADRPLTGYGPNSFYYHYKPYAVSAFRTYVSRNEEQSTTHNYFLYMLVEQGWPAMILYGVLVMAVFAQAQKIYYRFKDRFYKKVTLALAMMFAAGFVNNFFSELLETHKVGAMFYIAVALLVVLDRKSRELSDDPAVKL
ncbi:MAG TPA: O-antigen ligase family protein [Flavipsychrobacter sp.]|nr:O-antigen ligase family protein [Flavipsychrobacter sp.]